MFVNSLPYGGGELLSRIVELAGVRRSRPTLIRRAGAGLGLRAGRPDSVAMGDIERHLVYRAWRARGGRGDVLPMGTVSQAEAPTWLLDRWLASVADGRHLVATVPYSPEAASLLAEHGMRNLLMLRDPRAVVMATLESMASPGHELERDMADLGFEARLELVLQGGHAPLSHCDIVPFNEALDAMLAWSEEPDCEVVVYEDLIGPLGGGGARAQRTAVGRVLQRVGAATDADTVARVCAGAFDPAVTTTIDAWREHLTPAQVQLVSERLADAVAAVEAYDIAHDTLP